MSDFNRKINVQSSNEVQRNQFILQWGNEKIVLDLKDYLKDFVKKIMGDEFNEKKKKREDN